MGAPAAPPPPTPPPEKEITHIRPGVERYQHANGSKDPNRRNRDIQDDGKPRRRDGRGPLGPKERI